MMKRMILSSSNHSTAANAAATTSRLLLLAILSLLLATKTTNAFVPASRPTTKTQNHGIVKLPSYEKLPLLLSSSSSLQMSFTDGNNKKNEASSKDDEGDDDDGAVTATTTVASPKTNDSKSNTKKKKNNDDDDDDQLTTFISDFCIGTNTFWKGLVIKPVRDYVEIQPGGTARSDIVSKLIAPPEVPGIPRPVWLTILGSVPTALGWYGYYKFSVEEELYQFELQQNDSKVSGCGGYGTLFPFVYGIIIGFPLSFIIPPIGDFIVQAAAFWILAGQVNLYRRVNELCDELEEELGIVGNDDDNRGKGLLWEWWALLPPPLDVVVGLRQVHFLSEYWRIQRGEEYDKDIIAEELFPFISTKYKFTLKEFFRTPSMWFWFTKDWKDFDFEILKD